MEQSAVGENNQDKKVIACQHLFEGEPLFRVYYLSEEEYVWQFVCAKEHTEKDQKIVNLKEILNKFPEISELLEINLDGSVMFQKGKNSNKWYDFIIG